MSNTQPTTPYYDEPPHHNTMDVLSIIFFLVAGAWLIAALLYSLLVLCFLHMRSNGTLGDVYDENFGRVRLFHTNLYLPLGCIFRRYARHLQMETHHTESPHHNHVRFMTKDERRAAVQSVLAQREEQQQAAETTTTRTAAAAVVEKKGAVGPSAPRSSSSSEEDPTIPVVTTTAAKNGDNNDHDIELTIGGGGTTAGETKETDEDHDDNDNETPLCSICLCGFEPGDEDNIAHPCIQRHHAFHTDCILDWLQLPNRHDCPCCRNPIMDEDVVWRAVKKLRRQRKKQRQMEQQQQRKQQQQQPPSQQADNDLSETEQIDYDDDDDDDENAM